MDVQPGEGGHGTGVVGQVDEEALRGGFGDVEDQELLGGLLIFSVHCGRGERREDKLVHLQEESGREGRPRRLVGHGAGDLDWDPGLLGLEETKKE